MKEKFKNKKNNTRGILMIVAGVILEIGLSFVQYQYFMQGIAEADLKYTLIGPMNPVVALASIFIFAGFSMFDIKWKSVKLSSKTFLIYLFHAGVWG
ncbi:MAG: hypothetical protein LUH14_04210 [Clostridiaceae bacterium]|nr:hypothetical protein [Clostridiaceae bacterium]